MIPTDKQLHLLAGLSIMLTVSLFAGWQFGLGSAVVAAFGKELYDITGRGTSDLKDALTTIIGGFIGMGLIFLSEVAA